MHQLVKEHTGLQMYQVLISIADHRVVLNCTLAHSK